MTTKKRPLPPDLLTERLKRQARGLGFDLVGACPAGAPTGFQRLAAWIDAGHAGQMHYLSERLEAYRHPQSVLEGAQSILMLGMNYHTASPSACDAMQGRVSRYAWANRDYHDVIHERLRRLRAFLLEQVPGAVARGVVDTAPLLEREFAQRAGLGWIGKNTMLINKRAGSWIFLAALLTDQELTYDASHRQGHCGTCRACLDACPTAAFAAPYVLDATRCISYLTIELRDMVPDDLRRRVGDWVFGCDRCQEVCPWNRAPMPSAEPSFAADPRLNPTALCELFELDDEAFRTRFRRTPLWRTRRQGLLRNAAIALGNRPQPEAIPALAGGLNDRAPLVRQACAWALGRFEDQRATQALRDRLPAEPDAAVRREIAGALSRST